MPLRVWDIVMFQSVMALLQRRSSFPFSFVSLVSDACLLFDDFSLPGSGIFITSYFCSPLVVPLLTFGPN